VTRVKATTTTASLAVIHASTNDRDNDDVPDIVLDDGPDDSDADLSD